MKVYAAPRSARLRRDTRAITYEYSCYFVCAYVTRPSPVEGKHLHASPKTYVFDLTSTIQRTQTYAQYHSFASLSAVVNELPEDRFEEIQSNVHIIVFYAETYYIYLLLLNRAGRPGNCVRCALCSRVWTPCHHHLAAAPTHTHTSNAANCDYSWPHLSV